MAIYYIFGVIMMLTRTINYAEVSRQSEGKFYHSRLDAVIVTMGFKQIGWLLAMFIAIMFAYQGFSYLFSQSKLDFYLSQPTTRNQRIRKNFANAIGTFTMMYVVVEVIALIIAASMPVLSAVDKWWHPECLCQLGLPRGREQECRLGCCL